jgi:predicted RNA binding protein YcfA (HicA-like mRNA interferase family)
VTKAMSRKDVVAALRRAGCQMLREGASHTLFVCDCPERHKAAVPRHRLISPGVVKDIQSQIACLGKGWLQ